MPDYAYWVFYDSIAKIQSNALTKDEAQSTILKIRPQNIERFYIWTQGWQNWQSLKTYLESDQKNFVSTFTVSRSNEETLKATAKEIHEHTMSANTLSIAVEDTDTGTFSNTKSYSHILLAEETISRFIKAEQAKEIYGHKFDADQLKDSIENSSTHKMKLDFSRLVNKNMDNRAARHEFKIEVLLISKRGKTFRSRSVNISLSGALLEDTMPFEFYEGPFDIVIISNLLNESKRSRVKMQGEAVTVTGARSQRLKYVNPTDHQKDCLTELLSDYEKATKNKTKKVS
jgi:hypothetical protein